MNILSNVPLLLDGAFGTYYFASTGETTPCEQACLSSPDTVRGIHLAYLSAGAQAIITNTFAANPQTIPDEAQLSALLDAGLTLARQAAAEFPDTRVFADIGGITGLTAQQDYLKTTQLFHRFGADSYLFETLAELEPLLPALTWLKQHQPDALIFVSFAVTADGYTRKGLYYHSLLEECACCDEIDAAGLNCLCGPSHMVSLLEKLPPMPKPLIAMPNAGYPSTLNGRMFFEDNSAYFGEKTAQLYAAGADIIGGCCGTTPRHIACTAEALRAASHRLKKEKRIFHSGTAASPTRPTHKLIAVEVDPPLTPDCTKLLHAANMLSKKGVDWITVADSPLGRARMDSFAAAAKILRETGVRVLPHLSCRDRSAIGMKAALLGAAAEKIDELLIVTGDTPSSGGGVFEFHAAGLMRYVSELNADALQDAPFRMAGALNVNARNFATELERAKKKLQNGATMLLTQPIFSEQAVENLFAARAALSCTILAGILPVAGYKNARFLANEVTGIVIPQALLSKLQNAPEDAVQISVAFSADIVRRCFSAADGFYVMTPLGKTEIVCGLLDKIREFERKGEEI